MSADNVTPILPPKDDGAPTRPRRPKAPKHDVANLIKDDPDVAGMDVLDCLEMDGLEAPTAKMVGTYTEADLDECIALLRKLWTSICAEAESLERHFNGA